MTTVLQSRPKPESKPEPTYVRCTSYSRSRARYCWAFGRYECKDKDCSHRACGLHVIRNDQGIYCPTCKGPVRTTKD
jgi:hypothetical protein